MHTPIHTVISANTPNTQNDVIAAIRSQLEESVAGFIFQPVTEHTIQDMKNTIAVSMTNVMDKFEIMELSFVDSSTKQFEFDIVATHINEPTETRLTLALSSDHQL